MKNSVLEYLKNTVWIHGGKTAIIEGERRITFKELDSRAKRLGAMLRSKFHCIRQPVAVCLPKGIDAVTAFMGILYSGCFYVPLDIKSPLPRLRSIVENLSPCAIVTTAEYKDIPAAAGWDRHKLILLDDEAEECMNGGVCGQYDEELPDSVIDMDPAYIIYTSGSTGTPKGVVIPHRGILDYIDWAVESFGVDADTCIGNQSPFYFDNSTLDIYLCMAAGATLVIIPEQLFSFPAKLMEYLEDMRINFIFWVPSVLIHVANLKVLDSITPRSLRKILFAGEVMPNRHLNYWRRCIPEAVYANLYGPTEITVDCTFYVVDREFADDEPLPIGKACRNTGVILLNEQNREVSANETGELCVRGSGLALGYWNDPEKSSGVFVQNPVNSCYRDILYRTGDLAYYNERQEIIFVGRKDAQIKHMGYRIELGEIETAVMSLEGITNACVLYNRLKSEITLFYEARQSMDAAGIRKTLLQLLPKYMVPTAVHKLERLPVNANGKIDRPALQQEFIDGR